jgi:micrococcal nuclease
VARFAHCLVAIPDEIHLVRLMLYRPVKCLLSFLLPCLALVVLPALAQTYGNAEVAEVTSIYDADTFRVNVAHWPDVVGRRLPVRIRGVDAAELRGRCPEEKAAARAAKQFTVQALRSAKVIELRNIERGKYFRLIADVYVDGFSLGDQLIQQGHARRYDGGTRNTWCS